MEWHNDTSRAIDNLLTDKLRRPPVDVRIVRRDNLTTLLKTSIKRRVTLLVAPTGYGKTTLLVEWLSTTPQFNQHAVWVTLDQFDNTPLRFWAYIISGLKKAFPQIRFNPQQLIQRVYDPEDLTLLNPLLNEIASIPYSITLILDDYHAITNGTIHHHLSYFIEHLPQNLNLVISSRVVPSIPLSRLRAQRRLLEITERELAFSLPEAQSFLTNVMNLDIALEQVTALLKATEGWIAGLQLAALSYQSQPDTWAPQTDYPQDNRLVLDYLTEEVLNQQSTDVKEFLLKSSILKGLSAPLCDAVLERSDSTEILTKIESANLFMVCLDHNRCGYRYHSLFAQVLQIRLGQVYPQEVSKLHLRACDWLLANGRPDRAVSHALAAGALEKAAEIVDACAMKAIWEYDLTHLIQWINHFSKDMFIKRPRLGVYSALAHYHLRRPDQVESKLQETEQALSTKEKPLANETEKLLKWELAAIRAIIECNEGDRMAGVAKVRDLLETHPPEDRYFFGFLSHTLARAYDEIGEFEAAIKTYNDGYQFAVKYNHFIPQVHVLCALAGIRKRQGYLREAERKYQQAFDLAVRFNLDAGPTALAQSGLLETALEQNDIDQAEQWASSVVDDYHQILESPSVWSWLGSILLRLIKYHLAVGDREKAIFYFNDLKKYTPGNRRDREDIPWELIEAQVRIGLATEEKGPTDYNGLFEIEVFLNRKAKLTIPEQLTLARLQLAQNKPVQAQIQLENLESNIRNSGDREGRIEALILLALTYQGQGKDELAAQSIHEALLLAEPEGYMRIFIDEGDAMKSLLSRYLSAIKSGRCQKYAEKLIVELGVKPKLPFDDTAVSLPKATMLTPETESLSQRELEVLQMLRTQKSYKEIAATLTISVNTIKIHVKNIYRKLGVHSRKAALEQAKELKYLNGVSDS